MSLRTTKIKTMKYLRLFLILLINIVILSCEKEKDNESNLTLEKIDGFVQKGPYLNGTAVTISELTSDLIPTGKNFTSQILDNRGTFEIKNVNLTSQYVELKANGFYFNEVNNSNSSAQLTLFALSDLSNKSSLNVNVLSNLEKNRVDYLVSKGISFYEAKNQAQGEILAIFGISEEGVSESEELDITKTGDDNAILLAVSVILQGYLSVSDLSELLANISTDIREDGILNSQSLSSTLINNAKTIKLETIRTNLESRYEELGLDITIPDFEKFVTQFIDSTEFEFTGFIEYPETGKHGINILDKAKTDYTAGTYSMKAILPNGTNLKVKISGQNWVFPAFQDNTGWVHSDWDNTDNSQIFTATKTGEIDFEILFESYSDSTWSNKTSIFVYENDDIEPTWSKEISVN
jgi:hypothetical protein